MTPSFFAVVLIKTIWLHGILSNVEPFKWVRQPEPSVVVVVEPNMDRCLKDGADWRNALIKAALTDKRTNNIPLDAMNYKCDIVLEGGTTV